MKFIIILLLSFGISTTAYSQKLHGDNVVGNLQKVQVNSKNKSISYQFKKGNITRRIVYRFMNNAIAVDFQKGNQKQTLTIKPQQRYTLKKNGNVQQFNKGQHAQLFANMESSFAMLFKRNYPATSLGFSMIEKENNPTTQAFLQDTPLVKYLEFLYDAYGPQQCEEDMSCTCDGTQNETTNCPCGSIIQCKETTTIVCYTTGNNAEPDCEFDVVCTAVCFVPQ